MRRLLCTPRLLPVRVTVLRPAAATVPCWPPSRRGPRSSARPQAPPPLRSWQGTGQGQLIASPHRRPWWGVLNSPRFITECRVGVGAGQFLLSHSAVGFGLITNRLRLPCSFPAYLAASQPLLPPSSCPFLSPFPSFLHQGLGLLHCLLYRGTGTPPTHHLQDTIQLFGLTQRVDWFSLGLF